MTFRQCLLCGKKITGRLFSFPMSRDMRIVWSNILGLNVDDLVSTSRLCQLHFRTKDVGKKFLKKNVIPLAPGAEILGNIKLSRKREDKNHKTPVLEEENFIYSDEEDLCEPTAKNFNSEEISAETQHRKQGKKKTSKTKLKKQYLDKGLVEDVRVCNESLIENETGDISEIMKIECEEPVLTERFIENKQIYNKKINNFCGSERMVTEVNSSTENVYNGGKAITKDSRLGSVQHDSNEKLVETGITFNERSKICDEEKNISKENIEEVQDIIETINEVNSSTEIVNNGGKAITKDSRLGSVQHDSNENVVETGITFNERSKICDGEKNINKGCIEKVQNIIETITIDDDSEGESDVDELNSSCECESKFKKERDLLSLQIRFLTAKVKMLEKKNETKDKALKRLNASLNTLRRKK